MPSVKVREGEPFDSALRRFKRVVDKSGMPKEMRKREFHEGGAKKRQRKIAAAVRRWRKRVTSLQIGGGSKGKGSSRRGTRS